MSWFHSKTLAPDRETDLRQQIRSLQEQLSLLETEREKLELQKYVGHWFIPTWADPNEIYFQRAVQSDGLRRGIELYRWKKSEGETEWRIRIDGLLPLPSGASYRLATPSEISDFLHDLDEDVQSVMQQTAKETPCP